MNAHFWDNLLFDIKEWKERRKKKKMRKSYGEIKNNRATKNEFDAYQESVQQMVNRKSH